MRYLVTGGAGFIGSNIVAELLRRGEQVRVLDNFSTGRRENLRPFLGQCELLEGSITDLGTVRTAVHGVDIILHQAALPSVPRSVETPVDSNEVNVTGTLNVLVAAKDEKVRRVVLASSSSVYGDSPTLPKREDMVLRPLSPYAVSKLTGEQYARVFNTLYGLETICLRYFNVFGPNQDPQSQYAAVIPKFITSIMKGESPTIFGDGQQSRDFSFVANIVDANLKAALAPNTNGQAVNIACQETHTLLNLMDVLCSLLKRDIAPTFVGHRKGDILHSMADIGLARNLIGYHPTVGWEEGLKRTVVWYQR